MKIEEIKERLTIGQVLGTLRIGGEEEARTLSVSRR